MLRSHTAPEQGVYKIKKFVDFLRRILNLAIKYKDKDACFMRNEYKILLRKIEGRRPFEKTRRRRGVFKADGKERGCVDVEWIHLAPERGQCSCKHSNESSDTIEVG
jgi:hypothetical protein